MSMTLNQLVSSTASLLKEPFNHDLKERLIDSYKQLIATRIRHSIERHGLDEQLKLSYQENIEVLDENGDEIINFFSNFGIYSYEELEEFTFRTKNKVFEPIRFQNDAPFTFVGNISRTLSFPYRIPAIFKYSQSLFSIGILISYHLKNGRVILQSHDVYKLTEIEKIEIETLFYEPEKVITMLDNEDGLDTAIPLPHDVISGITHELLQKEFGIIKPSNIEVKIHEKEGTIQ